MPSNNPFKYSNDNKRYYAYDYYLKQTYGQKVYKVLLNAGFTCPNRDGTLSFDGCSFCSKMGSGDFTRPDLNLADQFIEGKKIMEKKWPHGLAIAYFQAYSNTYASLDILKRIYDPFLERNDIVGITIATRPDCISAEIVNYLAYMKTKKVLCIELGLQSIHHKSSIRTNRQHDLKCFENCVKMLRNKNISVVCHLMNSLPDESVEEMIESARYIASLDIQGIKIHMLHIMKDTPMGKEYQNKPFKLLNLNEYVDVVIRQLEVLPPTMIIERLSGDSERLALIAPMWTLNKKVVLNSIDKLMAERNTYQGIKYRNEEMICEK